MPTISGFEQLYETNFLEYSSYVIKDRAIPEINDGLKPVQRRILHSLKEMDDGKYHKVANVVGNTMKYHPHGDASINGALVTLANKGYFIDRQGNFGNLMTGDPASAPRYIEARLTDLAREVLFKQELTVMAESYDGRNQEPVCFPAKVPVLLLQGADGIAVGMSTRILPHNFNELLKAQIAILKKQPFTILPDFPSGGIADIREYEEGNGRVRCRARIVQKDERRLLIRELPFGTTTDSLIQSVEQAAKQGKIKISSIEDYTSNKVEIEITFQRGAVAKKALPALYRFTDCEVSLSVNLITIREGLPAELTVPEVLHHNTMRLRENLKRELELELGKLEDRIHAMTLERIFIENRLYKKIEEVKESFEKVLKTVILSFRPFKEEIPRKVTSEDAERLVKIQIRRISRFDIDKHRKDMAETKKKITEAKRNLRQITVYTIETIQHFLDKYGKDHPRRTEISEFNVVSASQVDLPEIKVGYDKKVGYLGSAVKGDKSLSVNPHARILTIGRDGSYRALAVTDKTFVGKNLLYLGIHDPEQVFHLVYKEKKTGYSYAKKFKIEKFIAGRDYTPLPEGATIQFISWDKKTPVVEILYVKKPRLKVTSEEFSFAELAIKGTSARGNRISSKEVDKVKRLRDREEEDGGKSQMDLF